MHDAKMTRRTALTMAAGALLTGGSAAQEPAPTKPKARLKQSVSRWCYGKLSLDELCTQAKGMGLVGIDLLGEGDWPTVKQHGLLCTMASQIGGIGDGWNRVDSHDRLVKDAERIIPLLKEAGLPNVVTFSGNRGGISDAEGMANCVTGLKRIAKLAEDAGVTVCMELLNSKRDHKDYQCDHTAWGVEMLKRVGSPRMKLLYDIYHMQIMEGDVIATIQENIEYLGHFHTGGVPGRAEIDETQELNYARIARAILDAGFEGYLAHEFVPRRDPLTSLRQAVRICDV